MKTCDSVLKVTGRYFLPSVFSDGFFDGLQLSSDGVDLVLQSTPNFWSMWDDEHGNSGIVRSEVVGFNKNLASWLFEGQNELIGQPMERVIKLKSLELVKIDDRKVKYFPPLPLDEAVKNAEGRTINHL